jgi:hypothetical protein|tara:strand:- start:1715 stop:1936 length:222 start_codon:yes stop_codon:yes gene_type:complete
MIGSKQIDRIVCIACGTLIGKHTKNGLGRCLFRIQGTFVAEGKKSAEGVQENESEIGAESEERRRSVLLDLGL